MGFPRLLRTVAYLKPRQVCWRLVRELQSVRVRDVEPVIRKVAGTWKSPIPKRSAWSGPVELTIQNIPVDVSDPGVWRDDSYPMLLLFHLHYLDELNAVRETGDNRPDELMRRWVAENPPVSGIGWDPYPLSLRIVNQVKWLLGGSTADESILRSVHQQAQALSQQVEYHILGNHLLANAKALFFAGCFFADASARAWLATASRILASEVDEQILADGGHFELSPMYQGIVIEDLLDLINLSRAYGIELPCKLEQLVPVMLDWLRVMTHPDGSIAHFNDAVGGNSPSTESLQDYAERLGIGVDESRPDALIQLRDSGFVRRNLPNGSLLIDVGEIGARYQPGHGHCDCLSFELSVADRRVIVNPGVSTYAPGERRLRERSTRAHNTVAVGDVEQSEIWGAFRVGRRARPTLLDLSESDIVAEHDGYRVIDLVHRRSFRISENRIRIDDLLSGPPVADRLAVARLHFHPSVDPIIDDISVTFDGGRITFSGQDAVHEKLFDYCRGFNDRQPAVVVEVDFSECLSTEIRLDEAKTS